MTKQQSFMRRTVTPEFFRDWKLISGELDSGYPLMIILLGLYTLADREGIFHWRPMEIENQIIPGRKRIDILSALNQLVHMGYIKHYQHHDIESNTVNEFGCISDWKLHQIINPREKQSVLPKIEDAQCTVFNSVGVLGAELLSSVAKKNQTPSAKNKDSVTLVGSDLYDISEHEDAVEVEVNTVNVSVIQNTTFEVAPMELMPEIVDHQQNKHKAKTSNPANMILNLFNDEFEADPLFVANDKPAHQFKVVSKIAYRVHGDTFVWCEDTADDSEIVEGIYFWMMSGEKVLISRRKLAQYEATYAPEDIIPKVKKSMQWLIDNGTKRKTFAGLAKYVNSFLNSKEIAPSKMKGSNSLPFKKPTQIDRVSSTMHKLQNMIDDGRLL